MEQNQQATGPPSQAQLVSLASRSIPPELGDDRFDNWDDQHSTNGSSFVGCTISEVNKHGEDDLIGFLGGFATGPHLDLDLLVDRHKAAPAALASDLMACTARQLTARPAQDLASVRIWTKPHYDWHDKLAQLHGLQLDRTLLQMRADLPASIAPLVTRGFVMGQDNEALRRVNNRAFAAHPDQGNQTPKGFDAALSQDWVDPDGIRLYEVGGQLAGFCWTKVHSQPPLGEIYVIGVDPDFHGQGLGKAMTASGLDWLFEQGQRTSMLYVEGNNAPAIATYAGLNFSTVRTDQSWSWEPGHIS